MKMGRFVVDTHVHSQRTAAGPQLRKKAEGSSKKFRYSDLGAILRQLTPYDNSARLLYDMETYSVDMCVIRPAMTFGMTNELNAQLVDKYPDKFVALCTPRETFEKALRGEIDWTIEAACEELDRLLSSGKFVGIGEGMPIDPLILTGAKKQISKEQRIREMLQAMDVARKHKVPIYLGQ
jgi:hypothetical protein